MDPSHPLPSTKKVLFGSTRSSTHNSSGEENCIPGTSQVFYGPINIPSTSSVRNQPGPSTSQLDSNDQSSSEQHALANALQRNLTLDSQSSDGDVPMWGQQPPANAQASEELHLLSPQQDVDRMGDDGYPLVTDMDGSDRQRELERQRVIERVIDQQAFDQDVIESLAHSNHQRVYGEESDETNGEDTDRERPPRNLMGNPAPVLNEDGSLTSRGQEIVNSYHSMMRNLAESRVSVPPMYYGDESNGAEIQSYEYNQMTASTSRRLLPAQFPANTSHVLAIGRKPSSSGQMNTVNRPANADETHPLGWQAAKSSLKERISYMYCNDVLADVYFIVGKDENRQRIPAHKFVLSIGSVVFDAMFNGGLTPNGQSANSLGGYDPVEIELPDVEATAFLTLLKFLYSDEVSIGPESVMTTLYTAKKYAVPAMESACVEFLKQSLGADNAFMLLTQARLFDEPQLAELCLEIIDKNTSEALTADGFTEIDLDTLCMVLTRDTLRVREAPLFQAVISWAKEECLRRDLEPTTDNKRIVLGKALQLIRFPLMTVEEFAQTAAQSGLLFDRELVNLFLHFTVNPKPPTTFIDRPRCAIAGKELVVNRFQRIEGRWGYSGTPDRIKFTVDRKIYVVGFGLHGSIHGPHEYQVTIQIIHCGTGKVLAHNDTSFVCDGSSNTFRVCFKEPVEMMPSVTYIASACLKGPDSHYGTKGLRRIVHQSASGGVVTFQFTYAAGNNNGTSVEDGQIPEIIFYTKLN